LRELHAKFMNSLAVNDLSTAKILLVDLHLMSAGYKATGSWDAIQISREVLTEAAQGVLYITERPKSYVNMIPTATYEGDNSVLLQQLSRVLIRYIELLIKGKPIKGVGESFNVYAQNVQERTELPVFDLESDPLTFETISKLLKDISFKSIATNAEKFMVAMGESDINTAWNSKMQYELVHMSKVYLIYQAYEYALTTFRTKVEKQADKSANEVVSNMLLLYGLGRVKELHSLGLVLGRIKANKGYERLIEEIRKVEEALKPQAEYIRGAIYLESGENGIYQEFDNKIIEEKGKPMRTGAEKIEKDFAMQFLKMSKL